MAYSRALCERYAREALKLENETPGFAPAVNLEEIARRLAIGQETGYEIAGYLKTLGWVIPDFSKRPRLPPELTITPKGHEEIPKMYGWRKWKVRFDNNSQLLTWLISVVALVVSLVRGR